MIIRTPSITKSVWDEVAASAHVAEACILLAEPEPEPAGQLLVACTAGRLGPVRVRPASAYRRDRLVPRGLRASALRVARLGPVGAVEHVVVPQATHYTRFISGLGGGYFLGGN